MTLSSKKRGVGDDASLIAPDNWSGYNSNKITQYYNCTGVIDQPPLKDFYCSNMRRKIAVYSKDIYFSTGVRFIIENIKDLILHNYNKYEKMISIAQNMHFDKIIFFVSDKSDVQGIYRLLIKLRLNRYKTTVIAVTDKSVMPCMKIISKHNFGLKLISSHENITLSRKKIIAYLNKKNSAKLTFPATLTARQFSILSMAAAGLSPKDIALKTGISICSVYSLKSRALDKAGALDKSLEAILYSQFSGIH